MAWVSLNSESENPILVSTDPFVGRSRIEAREFPTYYSKSERDMTAREVLQEKVDKWLCKYPEDNRDAVITFPSYFNIRTNLDGFRII